MSITPAEFSAYVKTHYPELWAESVRAFTVLPASLGATDGPDEAGTAWNWNSISRSTADFLSDVANRVLAFQRQQAVDRINADRVRAGLAPVDENFIVRNQDQFPLIPGEQTKEEANTLMTGVLFLVGGLFIGALFLGGKKS